MVPSVDQTLPTDILLFQVVAVYLYYNSEIEYKFWAAIDKYIQLLLR